MFSEQKTALRHLYTNEPETEQPLFVNGIFSFRI